MQKYAVYWPEGGAASQYSVFIGQKSHWLARKMGANMRKGKYIYYAEGGGGGGGGGIKGGLWKFSIYQRGGRL
jgi:hypothetical protein